jgi:hypothetical protein
VSWLILRRGVGRSDGVVGGEVVGGGVVGGEVVGGGGAALRQVSC